VLTVEGSKWSLELRDFSARVSESEPVELEDFLEWPVDDREGAVRGAVVGWGD